MQKTFSTANSLKQMFFFGGWGTGWLGFGFKGAGLRAIFTTRATVAAMMVSLRSKRRRGGVMVKYINIAYSARSESNLDDAQGVQSLK